MKLRAFVQFATPVMKNIKNIFGIHKQASPALCATMKLRKRKHSNVKSAALRHQGCCGIFACVMAAGRRIANSAHAEHYRQLFLKNVQGCRKPPNWMGGTHEWERAAFLLFLGVKHVDVTPQTEEVLTLQKLLCSRSMYQTQAQYIVTVTEHCLFVKTNRKKTELYCMDQRGIKMRLCCKEFSRELKKHVDSVWRILGS